MEILGWIFIGIIALVVGISGGAGRGIAARCSPIPQTAAHVATSTSPMAARILVAGIGNIFLGDDGFGSEVVRQRRATTKTIRLSASSTTASGACTWPTTCSRSGTRWCSSTRCPAAASPGTLHVFQADHETANQLRHASGLDAHSMDPAAVFASLRALGGTPPYTVVVGCEAGSVEEGIGLTEPGRQRRPPRRACGRGDRRGIANSREPCAAASGC